MRSYPGLDDAYRAFISEQPCLICGAWPSDPAHSGSRIEFRVGMGQKAPDATCVPLCRAHHDEQHRLNWPAFSAKYHLDLPAILARLQAQYQGQGGAIDYGALAIER